MNVVAVTMNPAVDITASVPRIMPVHKLRCASERRDPGGGGINVARVAARLGTDVGALYPIGGPTGELLRHLLDREGIFSLAVPISGETREDLAIFDEQSHEQYRFVLPGPTLAENEWQACLDIIGSLRGNPSFIVASALLAIRGRPEEALDWMDAAMRLNPFHPTWYNNHLGIVLYSLRRYAEAAQAFKRLPNPGLWLSTRLAACYAQLGQTVETEAQVAVVLRQRPNFSTADFLRRDVLLERAEDRELLRDGLIKAGLPE